MVSVEHHSASEGMLPPVGVSRSPISFCSSRDSRPQQQGRVGCPGFSHFDDILSTQVVIIFLTGLWGFLEFIT